MTAPDCIASPGFESEDVIRAWLDDPQVHENTRVAVVGWWNNRPPAPEKISPAKPWPRWVPSARNPHGRICRWNGRTYVAVHDVVHRVESFKFRGFTEPVERTVIVRDMWVVAEMLPTGLRRLAEVASLAGVLGVIARRPAPA
jgi:hypothetical protein